MLLYCDWVGMCNAAHIPWEIPWRFSQSTSLHLGVWQTTPYRIKKLILAFCFIPGGYCGRLHNLHPVTPYPGAWLKPVPMLTQSRPRFSAAPQRPLFHPSSRYERSSVPGNGTPNVPRIRMYALWYTLTDCWDAQGLLPVALAFYL